MAPEKPSPLLGEVRGILVYTTTLVCAFVKAALEKSSLSQPLNCFSQRYFFSMGSLGKDFCSCQKTKCLQRKPVQLSIFVSMSLSFFLLIVTVCQSNQSPTTGLDPVLNMER